MRRPYLICMFAVAIAIVWSAAASNSARAQAPRYQASFDCSKKSTPVERAICGSEQLAAKDRELTAVYKQLRGSLPKDQADQLAVSQRQWLDTRDATCGTVGGPISPKMHQCVAAQYQERLATLQGMPSGTPTAPLVPEQLAGTWKRSAPGREATLVISSPDARSFSFRLTAVQGMHTGEAEGKAFVTGNEARFESTGEARPPSHPCTIIFGASSTQLSVRSQGCIDEAGDTTFDGLYSKGKG